MVLASAATAQQRGFKAGTPTVCHKIELLWKRMFCPEVGVLPYLVMYKGCGLFLSACEDKHQENHSATSIQRLLQPTWILG